MTPVGRLLGGLSAREFLARHWQRRPLLVRGALPGFVMPVGRRELLQLACDPTVTSRRVCAPSAERDWETAIGPFEPEQLEALPHRGWTLLLHEMDRRFAELAALLDRFRFVPNWRIDDVMVSYATDGGGVGPHIDRYDVFLLQVAGRRRWRVASKPQQEERLVPGIAHRVLQEFDHDREWLLEPGDMLYLPPRVAHDGVAVGECMTCSIGFRAPDPREMCAGFLRQLHPEAFDAIRYTDPDLRPATHAGELTAAARRHLRESATALFAASGEFDDWLGRFVTTPARRPVAPAANLVGPAALRELLAAGHELARSAPSHFAWYRAAGGEVRLFVGGEVYRLDAASDAIAELLCGRRTLDLEALEPHLTVRWVAEVVSDLANRGFLEPRVKLTAS